MTTTWNPGSSDPHHIVAGESFVGKQYRAVKQTSGKAFVAIEGDPVWGIIQDSPILGGGASVVVHGFSKVAISATVAENELIGPLTDGTCGPTSSSPIARAAEAGIAGDNILSFVNLAFLGPVVTGSQTKYHKTTTTAAPGTPRTAADWPGGNPGLNAALEVEYLPVERERREIYRWNGAAWLLQEATLLEPVVPAHGLDLTTIEGERVPVAWFDNGVVSRAPASIDEVTHFAVSAPDENTLRLRTSADIDGRVFDAVTNPVGLVRETMYWNAATNTHQQAVTDLRLFQISDVSTAVIKFDLEDTRSTVTGPITLIDNQEWAYQLAADVAKDVEIVNASFVPIGDTTGDPPFDDWATNTEFLLFAGANLAARSGDADTDLLGTGTATGVSFNQNLYLGETVVLRKLGTIAG